MTGPSKMMQFLSLHTFLNSEARPSPSIKDMNTRPMSVWSSLSKLICISIVVDWLVVGCIEYAYKKNTWFVTPPYK
jgi:hypothetical protein